MGVGETITVINKSGKVVSSSKHIVSVFKEAKAAYRERKAEIKAERDAAVREKQALSRGVEALRIEDDVQSRASSHRSSHSKASHRSKSHRSPRADGRPTLERGYTDSFYANDSPRGNRHRFEDDLAGGAREGHMRELARRNSDQVPVQRQARRNSVDMDLAYGDIPPPLPDKKYDDVELKDKASKITMLLDEANCLQHSATAMIENLQKNPDALAAVSLTLAEISAIVSKMGPGVLTTLKGSFPAVAALLMSPQFMIAGGVAVGVTIVALGGYKIIKKIQQQKEDEMPMLEMPMGGPVQMPIPMQARADEPYQLDELETKELGRIDMWRRGIADVEAESSGCSVDGEFITPGATRQLVDAGVLDEDDIKSRRSVKARSERPKSHRARSDVQSVHSVRSEARSEARSERSAHTSKTSGTHRSKTTKEGSKRKEKEPSLMKQLFRSKTTAY
ncbi:hypothetical protein C7974DRAFT_183462 [Boeremia exigua]|uniref:uncharacterized protein n=1 Tax=Boeremia exigua TaxID=749465 RepID=UPI001E8E846D|nr:uncharacterized protein C7974DRAFT_183462 [Boeremia exigua]KAH6629233.1 hypothetical protein C7974DRAFT_183462 [Boeremia exigua]